MAYIQSMHCCRWNFLDSDSGLRGARCLQADIRDPLRFPYSLFHVHHIHLV